MRLGQGHLGVPHARPERRPQPRLAQLLDGRQPRHPRIGAVRARGRGRGAVDARAGRGQRLGRSGGRLPGVQGRDHASRFRPLHHLRQGGGRGAKLQPPAQVALKNPKDWQIAGKSLLRLDTADKLNGKQVYGFDLKLPGMLNCAVKACPVFGGKIASIDEAKVLSMPGVKRVLRADERTVAVVADTYWQAQSALNALPIVWDEGPHAKVSSADIDAMLRGAERRAGLRGQQAGRCEGRHRRSGAQGRGGLQLSVPEPRLHGAHERDRALDARQVRGLVPDAER